MQSRTRSRLAIAVALLCAGLGASLAINPAVGVGGDLVNAPCAGFKNQTGITRSVVWLGNAADVSGPVPNLHRSAQLAAKAYVTYFNASGKTICGRKLGLRAYDSKTDAGGDLQAYQAMCSSSFAAVGSISNFDSGGAAMAQNCGLPDVRVRAVTNDRIRCNTCFGVNATWGGEVPNSIPDYFTATHQGATQSSAMLYLNDGASNGRALALEKVSEQRGFKFVYSSAIDIATFNYGPYVQQMKSKSVKLVEFLGAPPQAARLAKAMKDAAFKPEVFLVDGVAYDQTYVAGAGAAGEGTIIPINHVPLTATSVTELNRYKKWLLQIAPSEKPTPEGLYAWSAAKLFTEQAIALGGRLLRPTLVANLRAVKGWTGSGLHAPQAVGTEHASPCVRFLSLHNGKWISIGGTTYRCNGVTRAS